MEINKPRPITPLELTQNYVEWFKRWAGAVEADPKFCYTCGVLQVYFRVQSKTETAARTLISGQVYVFFPQFYLERCFIHITIDKRCTTVGITEDHRIIHRTCTSSNNCTCIIGGAVFEGILDILELLHTKNTHKYTELSLAEKVCTFLTERSRNRRFSTRQLPTRDEGAWFKSATSSLTQWCIIGTWVFLSARPEVERF